MPSLLRRIERAAGRDTTVTFVLGGALQAAEERGHHS